MTSGKSALSHVLIRASAGTGKTFQLSNRYIGLAADGAPLDSLLATTFTRKAAGEILDRVLYRLAEAALNKNKLNELNEKISPAALDPTQCLALVAAMLRNLHRLRVGTLDSFFIQIAQAFSLELGLAPGWRVMDEVEELQLRHEAIQMVLQESACTDIVLWIELLNPGAAARSVSSQLTEVAKKLYSLYLEAPRKAWQPIPRKKPLTSSAVKAALKRAAEVDLPAHKSIANARNQALQHFQDEAWEAFIKNGLIKNIVKHAPTYYKKPIEPEVTAAFEPLIAHAGSHLINRLADQTETLGRVLARFDQAFLQLKSSRSALRFEDVTNRLNDADLKSRLNETAHRLDAQISHLLLDEFQDTSLSQWEVLRPFARQVTEEKSGKSFFCVGDMKQAIYSWRGGMPEIFEAIEKELTGLEPQSLDKSWRSSGVVIDTVNKIFESLDNNEALTGYEEAGQRWSGRFTPHTTEYEKLPGYCRLEAADRAGEGERQLDRTLSIAASRIAELHRRQSGRTIGVLVRKNDAVSRLIYLLRSIEKIEASEEGGNPLTDTPAVQLVLSLLEMADHPGDRTARYHLARSPLGKTLGFEDPDDEAAAWSLSQRIRNDLIYPGYGPLLHEWTRKLAPHLDRRDLFRLSQLTALGYRFENDMTLRPADFVDRVKQHQVESPSSAMVRVMTIHQAKGLQFDTVVLPQLETRLTGVTPPLLIAGRSKPTGPIEHFLRYAPKEIQNLLPRSMQASFDRHKIRVTEESLSLLYVALTRAKRALHMIIPPTNERERKIPATCEGLLRVALAHGARAEAETVLYENGDPDWHDDEHHEKLAKREKSSKARQDKKAATKKSATPKKSKQKPPAISLAKSPRKARRGLERISPSSMDAGNGVDLSLQLGRDASAILDRGTLIHAWLEMIEWIEQGVPDDETLIKAAGALSGLSIDPHELIAWFRKTVKKPSIRSVLSRTTYQESTADLGVDLTWEARREQPFAFRADDTIVNGKIDRLVIGFKNRKPLIAEVLDFKTDHLDPADSTALKSRLQAYEPQLNAYRLAASRLLGMDEQKISTRLVFLETGAVEKVAQ